MPNVIRDVIRRFLTGLSARVPGGKKLLWNVRRLRGTLPRPDMEFPLLVAIEISSACNLSCVHCPPQGSERTRKPGFIEVGLFERIMAEVDAAGRRRVALHKDGEPLLHPDIEALLARVKFRVDHEVYLSTNGHHLDNRRGRAILDAGIDIVNFSIGAATGPFYERVRGRGFDRVVANIEAFLELRDRAATKPRLIAQIVRLPEFAETNAEIRAFRRHWESRGLEVQVWDKLSWGVYESVRMGRRRYPCFSLWESMTVNSDGKVSACCVDWRQELLTGDTDRESLREIWHGSSLARLRKSHVEGVTDALPVCPKCNYWEWYPQVPAYPLVPAS